MGIQYQEEQIGGVFADRYELRSLLGDGGMGRVYLAADRMLGGELVALKILHPSLCSDPRYTQRFLREVQVTRRVTHPNVVRTYDIGTFDGRVFFTMEYAEGKTLKEVLSASRVGPAEVCDILQQICQGLSLIHAEGVVHRDLKPGNVILSPEGVVKLTDFGIARTGFSDITGHNEVVGSAAYMAPEAWLGKQIDQRTDIYALGILCYELLTGTLPFDAESPPQMMCLHLQETPAPIRLKASAVPEWLEQIVFRMIQKEPENRFQNVDQILGVLNGAGSPEPETAPESAILSSVHVAEVEQDPKTVVRPKKQGKQKRFSSSSLLPSPKLLNLGTAIAVILLFERALAWSDPFALGFVSQSMSSLALVFAGALLVGLYALVAATPALALLSFYRGIKYAFSAWLKVAFTLVVATIAVIATDVYSLYELSIKTASKPEVARKIGSRRIPEFIFS